MKKKPVGSIKIVLTCSQGLSIIRYERVIKYGDLFKFNILELITGLNDDINIAINRMELDEV